MKTPVYTSDWLRRFGLALGLLTLALCLCTARAESIVHQGPVLDIQVQRGEERLPMSRVPRLQRGDQLLVRPDPASLAQGDWILMLGLIAPAGNKVQTQAIDLGKLNDFARLEIGEDDQAPVIVLAPQLRNLFGLYTSFRDSSTLLDEVIQSDPQRFYDLQRLDEVNQAISALAQGLDQVVLHRNPTEGIAAARAMALKFGVSQVDPECFRNNTVNTQCVALNIVANKDFVLPSSNELGMLAGSKSMADLTGFLLDKVKVFSDAGDFLSNKFRDQYDFAATFGRSWRDTTFTQLFSLSRFRKGNIKTAYVYVTSWFRGRTPALSADGDRPICLTGGQLQVHSKDRMPVVNPWHGWRMVFSDPATGAALGESAAVTFTPGRSSFTFTPPVMDTQGTPWVSMSLQGFFGFDPVRLAPVRMAVPPAMAGEHLTGLEQLVSGETAALQVREPAGACVQSLTLSRGDVELARSSADQGDRLVADLGRVPPGAAQLRITMPGKTSQTLPVRILPPRAVIKTVEHTDLQEHLVVTGLGLERIARVQAGTISCRPVRMEKMDTVTQRLLLACDADVHRNATLPDKVLLHHDNDEPAPLQMTLKKNASAPKLMVASTPQGLLVQPSEKARRWGLDHSAQLLTEDSGLNLLLQVTQGYVLSRGGYSLELRFADDPVTTHAPVRIPLMADLAHQELRTRKAIQFKGAVLPTVVNPLEYRVVQDSTGLAGEWTALQRSVLMLPQLGAYTCAATHEQGWLHGQQLDLIDAVGWTPDALAPAQLQSCPDGLCLLLPQAPAASDRLFLRLHWLTEPVFAVEVGQGPGTCP